MTVRRLLVTALAAVAGLPAATAAAAVPDQIAVTDGSKPFLTALGIGVQIYGCTDGAWTLSAPRAVLVDRRGKQIGTHYAGPRWELRDGSVVQARRDAGTRVDPTSIDWLRLAVTATAAGEDGDRLVRTRWIQRINTVYGLAPAGLCATGQTVEVPYTADYVFWR